MTTLVEVQSNSSNLKAVWLFKRFNKAFAHRLLKTPNTYSTALQHCLKRNQGFLVLSHTVTALHCVVNTDCMGLDMDILN